MTFAQALRPVLGWSGHAWLGALGRLYLGGVFVLAAWHKIADPQSFAVDVATYELLPLWAVNATALVLPWVEIIAGAALILGFRTRAASLLVMLMMTSFLAALLWALSLGLDMACGCFASQGAVTEDPISWHTLVRDSAWLVIGGYVFWFDRTALGIDRFLANEGGST